MLKVMKKTYMSVFVLAVTTIIEFTLDYIHRELEFHRYECYIISKSTTLKGNLPVYIISMKTKKHNVRYQNLHYMKALFYHQICNT